MIISLGLSVILSSTLGLQRREFEFPFKIKRDAEYWAWTKWSLNSDAKLAASIRRIDQLYGDGSAGLRKIETIAIDAMNAYNRAPKADAKVLTVWNYASYRAGLLDVKQWPKNFRETCPTRLRVHAADRQLRVCEDPLFGAF